MIIKIIIIIRNNKHNKQTKTIMIQIFTIKTLRKNTIKDKDNNNNKVKGKGIL